ncbi:tRNA (adenosine(37)-N6)-dimethylallyltransferase MiaA [Peribacillus faecalis]|uniref:tRNA (adenosine(37)-N6)-dimethylallyltransferase MiaA n=1 Tax=Peribacillus faecalis TaxID=2772559 RepID=UPI0038B3B3AF
MSDKQKVVVIMGPTAVGKTKLSIDLAKAFNGEIISGDSMQIYKGMDIGTAKIKKEEMQGVPHHLIDIIEPTDSFNVAQFQELVTKCIDDITSRGKLPIIAGGTGLYIEAVLQQYSYAESVKDEEYRLELEQSARENGVQYVHNLLADIDEASAERIHPNNVRRVIRALEIYHCTGKKMSEQLEKQNDDYVYDAALIGLTMERERLYERINRRVDIMAEEGLLEEVQALYDQGIRDCQSIQAIGYKELYEYFDGKVTYEQAIENLKQNSRRYAKRQLTWFRNKMNLQWFEMNPGNEEKNFLEICSYIEEKLDVKRIFYYTDL